MVVCQVAWRFGRATKDRQIDHLYTQKGRQELGRTQGGGLGLKPPFEFSMLQKRHYLYKGVCVCFRTFFACLMST